MTEVRAAVARWTEFAEIAQVREDRMLGVQETFRLG